VLTERIRLTKPVSLYEIPLLVKVIDATKGRQPVEQTFLDRDGTGVLVKHNSDTNLRDINALMKYPIVITKAKYFADAYSPEHAIGVCQEKCSGMKVGSKVRAAEIDTSPGRLMLELPPCNRTKQENVVHWAVICGNILLAADVKHGQCCIMPTNKLERGCAIDRFHKELIRNQRSIPAMLIKQGGIKLKFVSYRNVIGESAKAKAKA
jgi:hypothetical protein